MAGNTIKRRNYTFALTKDNDRIIEMVEKYPKYAYILHDADKGEDHVHYYIEFPNPRALSSVAKELGIPEHMIEAVHNKKGILQYLTHENSPDKYHYPKTCIVSNFDLDVETQEVDVIQEASDYYDVLDGKMSWVDFLTKYKSYCTTLSIRSRIDVYNKLGNEGACPRSEFHVPQQGKWNKKWYSHESNES